MKKTFFKFILSAILFLLSGNATIFANASADNNLVLTSQSVFNVLQGNQDNLIIHSVPFNSDSEQATVEAVEFELEEENSEMGYAAPFSFESSFEFYPYFARSKIKYYTASSQYSLTTRKYLLFQVFRI